MYSCFSCQELFRQYYCKLMMDDNCTILFVYILDIKDRLVIGKDQRVQRSLLFPLLCHAMALYTI